MLQKHHLFRRILCMILTPTLILLPVGCERNHAVKIDVVSTEMKKNDIPNSSKNTISSAEYTYYPAIQCLDNEGLLDSLDTQIFELDCPILSSDKNVLQEPVFVKLRLPELWTQDDESPTLFYFPDGTIAMLIEILPLEKGQCIWSTERLWEDKSCINYSEKYINYSWNTFPKYSFYSIHSLAQQNLYDYTYYLPYGSSYFAIHFYTAGENNELALRLQKILLETIQLLTPIPSDPPVLLSGENWEATVSFSTSEPPMELMLHVPVEWAQEKPESSVFYNPDKVGCISSMSLVKLQSGQTIWDIADEKEQLLQLLHRTAVANGQEIPLLVFTPPYKPGEDGSEEFGHRLYYYYLPIDDFCLSIHFSASGVDNQRDIELHQKIMESINIKNKGVA